MRQKTELPKGLKLAQHPQIYLVFLHLPKRALLFWSKTAKESKSVTSCRLLRQVLSPFSETGPFIADYFPS